MKAWMRMTVVLFGALLAACGGGGGGSAPPATPNPPVTAPTPPVTMSPTVMKASYIGGYPVAISMSATPNITFTGNVYIQAVAIGAPISPYISMTPNSDGTFAVGINTSASALPGAYAGDMTVSLCYDANCTNQVTGSPFKIPYQIEVIDPAGSMKAYNLSPLSPVAGAPDWQTFQGNAAHTGYVPVTLDASRFNARWKSVMPSIGGVPLEPSMIATGGGKLYFTTGSFGNATRYELLALNEHDGGTAWTKSFATMESPSTNPPAYANGAVYTSAGSQYSAAMYAFDAQTGAQRFATPFFSQWQRYLAPTVYGNGVYGNCGSYGGLCGYDATTGTSKFFADVNSSAEGWTPAVDGQYAYAYLYSSLSLLDAQTGARVATITDTQPPVAGNATLGGAPVLGAAGSVFGAYGGITNFDTVANSVRWRVAGTFFGTPAYAETQWFAGNNETGALEVRKESDGQLLWSWNAPKSTERFVSEVVATKNLLFVSTNENTYAIDRTSHLSVWTYPASGRLAISANGVLYIKGVSSIVAVNLK